ncbi:MAG: hypothetical protein LBI05_04000, partial [Planctomycetaceae bacterium]|nr:hypothetical protein [Planctomycetaceae bacterium]
MKTYTRLLCFLIFFVLFTGTRSTALGEESLIVYTTGHFLRVMTAAGQEVLRIEFRLWGPDWAWTGIEGNYQPDRQSAHAMFNGRIGRTDVPFIFHMVASIIGKRRLIMDGEFTAERDSELVLAGIGLVFGEPLRGEDRASYIDATGTKTHNIPLGMGTLTDTFNRITVEDAEGKVYGIRCTPPLPARLDGEIRLILAENRIKGNEPQQFTLQLDLPEDTAFYLTPDDIPNPPDWEHWFPWTATADCTQPSVIDTSYLLESPAGKHGRIMSKGDQLIYNGKPIKLWGLNTCYEAIASPKAVSEQRAAFYAKYGVNAVRLHKFADGPDWDGVLDRNSYVRYNSEKLALMDYYVAQLKEKGIYVLLSANFGRARVYRDDMQRVPYIAELGQPNDRGQIDPGGGALFISTELQDIQIEQLTTLLKHPNAEPGLTYAADPCVMCVELVNEDCAFFYNTMKAMTQSPTLKARMGREFAAWLKTKYKTEAAFQQAWGNVLNVFTGEQATGESFNDGNGPIYPVGNPWFYDPDRLDGTMQDRRQRLVDTMLFWYDKQNEFFDRFVAAIRATGYTGEIITSNWQAGRGPSHFLNLHSDRRIGMIDRHNYFEGPTSMFEMPGTGLLSTGMQQVADRPFMFSEWIHTFPSEFCLEGPVILGAYGMGLNDWDVSFMFQNSDQGHFLSTFPCFPMQRFIPFILFLVGSTLLAAEPVKVSVADFGAEPNTKKDCITAVAKALEACKQHEASILIFPKGRYDFYAPSGGQRVAIPIAGQKNLVLDGDGSEFIFHGILTVAALTDSQNITLRNFSVDWDRPMIAQGTILNTTDESIDIQFDKAEYPYEITDGKIFFLGEGWRRQVDGYSLLFDKTTKELVYNTRDYTIGQNDLFNTKAEEIAPGTVRFHGKLNYKAEAGTIIALWLGRYVANVFTFTNCKDITMEDINVYHGLSNGVVGFRTENVTFRNFNFRTNEAKNRVFSLVADGFHFNTCKGLIKIENCEHTGMGDDFLNIHGMNVMVQKRIDDYSVEVGVTGKTGASYVLGVG